MPRNLPSQLLAIMRSQTFPPVVFIHGVFTSGDLRIWSGLGSKGWGGQTWSGVGGLVSVELPQESATVEANNFTITLSGINPDHINLALNECVQGNRVEVWVGSLADDGTLYNCLAAAGSIDVPMIEESAITTSITITCESALVDMHVPRFGRYTHADQQMRHAGDNGFKFVASIMDWNRRW